MPMPAAGTAHEISFVGALMVVLASASVVALLLHRLRLALIPIYLLTGTLIGPHALGLVGSVEILEQIAHLAMILLLFGIGLDLELTALRHGLVRMATAGFVSCALTVVVAWPLVGCFGLRPPAALAVSLAFSLSSTALVLRILGQRRELDRVSGRMALAILVVQDILVLGMLAALPLLGRWAELRGEFIGLGALPELVAGDRTSILRGAVGRGAGIAALVLIGRLALPRLLSESLRTRSLEVLLLVGVATALAAGVAAKLLGFSLEIGAFLAGFLLSGTAVRHQLSAQVAPLRDIFMAVFFTTLGMRLDPGVFLASWWILGLALVLLVATKTLAIGFTCWSLGITAATAAGIGLTLAQAGEFSLVLLDGAQRGGLLAEQETSACIALVFVSLCLTPLLSGWGSRLARAGRGQRAAPWVRRGHGLEDPAAGTAEDRPLVVIAGYGPVGREVAQLLEAGGIRHAVIDLNPHTVQAGLAGGGQFIFGDAGRSEVLEAAGLAGATVLALTIPDEPATVRACVAARQLTPEIFIVARVTSASRRPATLAAGADMVIADELAAAKVVVDAIRGRCPMECPPASQ